MAKKAGSASKSTSSSRESALKNKLQGIDRKLANLAKKVKAHATDPLSSVNPKSIRAVFENEFGTIIATSQVAVNNQIINNRYFYFNQYNDFDTFSFYNQYFQSNFYCDWYINQ